MSLFIRACVALSIGGAVSIQVQPIGHCIGEASVAALGNTNTAFVMGGMGKYGTFPGLNKCVALAETLGRIGGWPGRVYIMTDTLPNATELSKATKGNANMRFIKIPSTRGGVDFRLHSAGGGGGYLKTMIFDLPEITEDILIWHDCDKMIGQTGCIADMWLKAPLEFGPDKEILVGSLPSRNVSYQCPVAGQAPGTTVDGVYCERDGCHKGWGQFSDRCGDGIHVGVFAAHRRWSKRLVDQWKHNQQKEPSVYDRYTFWDAWIQVNASVQSLPHVWHDQMYSKTEGVQCVNHMSGPRVWAEENRGFLEPFLEGMCMKGVSYAEAYEVYANILKFKVDRYGQESLVMEQRYMPLEG